MFRALRMLTICLMLVAFVASSALAFKEPVIKLEAVDPVLIQEFFVKPRLGYKDEKEPGKEAAFGSILIASVILDIKNVDKAPIQMEEMQFVVNFDGIPVNTSMVKEPIWIAPGKSSQVRATFPLDAFMVVTSLMLGSSNVQALEKMGVKAGELAKKWWTTLPEGGFPVTVTQGQALFKDEKGKEATVTFTGAWGKGAPAPAEEKKADEPKKKGK
jgi:hypothetical protein